LEFNEKEIKEELIHSQILDHIVFNACFGKHKSLNAFCLFLSLESLSLDFIFFYLIFPR